MICKRIWIGIACWMMVFTTSAQTGLKQAAWFGQLKREDGKVIRFHFDIKIEKNKTVMYLVNDAEHLRVDNIRYTKDSVFIEMPVFESYFKAKRISASRWEGSWTKGGSVKWQVMPFIAETQSSVPPQKLRSAVADISGKWAVTFTKADKVDRPGIGEWQQKGNTLHGTILTPTGDYRYLTGIVNGDSMQLSTFDGAHAFLLTAKIKNGQQITGGVFYSGATSSEPWEAIKNENVKLPNVAAMYMKDDKERLNFRFMDLDKKVVSITDAKFKNKVVIIQIMGSWCPNCMDETAFLSDFYKKNKQRGIEIIGLAYEYTTDFDRSVKSIRKFRDRFKVEYTMLNTGVTVSDSLRTEKTLPQMTQIKSFPTTIFLDKNGKVAKVKAGFEGPGTGAHYEEMKKEFETTIDKLLKQ